MGTRITAFTLIASIFICLTANGQGVPLSETILVSNSQLKKNIDPESYKRYMISELVPAWNRERAYAKLYLLKADRGDRNGELLTICLTSDNREPKQFGGESPFNDKIVASLIDNPSNLPSEFLENPETYTEYRLIKGKRISPLPFVEILGIHYLKVRPEMTKTFERLVIDKLHPTVGNLTHDMNLLYYKAVSGQNKGSFITIFAIESVEARERFWPTGGQEQEIVKILFGKYNELASELGTYLEENSYLKPESGGGAAYFESTEWTDFVFLNSE